MRIFDPHIHMTSRTTDDYERMAAAGVRAVVEPAFWLGQPRTSVGSFTDYFDSLIGWEPFRAGAVRHPPPLHDRAQPQGGQRPALPRGARPAAALPGQGRRGRGRRDRLRLDDARRRTRPSPRSSRWPSSTTCRRWCTPRTGTRPRGTRRTPGRGQGVGHRPGPGAGRPPQRGDRRRWSPDTGCWLGFSIYPDTKMSPPRMVAILRELRHRADAGQLGRRLGPLRPAADPCAPARRCCAAGFTDDDVDRVLWRNPVEFYGQSGRLDLRRRRRRRRPTFAGNSILRGRRLMRLRHPDGTTVHLGYCTNVHPAEDLDGILAQLDTYAVPVRGDARRRRARPRAVAGRPGRRRAGRRPAAARARLRAELDARGPGGGHPQRLPVPGLPGAGGQARRLPARLDRPATGCAYTLDLARVLADLLPDDAARGSISTLPLAWREPWDAGRAGAPRQRRSTSWPPGWPRWPRSTGRPVRVGFEPEPGCVVETTAQAVAALSDVDTDRLGICLDLAHLACAWEEPADGAGRLARGRAAGGQGAGLRRAGGRPTRPRAADRAARATSSRASCTRPGSRGGRGHRRPGRGAGRRRCRGAPWRVHFHVPLHAAPDAAAAQRPAPVLRAALAALLGGRRPAATTSRSRPTPGRCCRRTQRPADDAGAGRRHRRRAGLRPRPSWSAAAWRRWPA